MAKKQLSSADELYEAVLTLETIEDCRDFFTDLCTVNEILAMEQRFKVAKLLDHGMIYSDIVEETGASSATISRVSRSLNYGEDGYRRVLDKLKERVQ